MIDKLMSLEIVDLILFLVKIIILAVMWTVIMTLPFIPKVLKTQINKWNQKHAHYPSVTYLPDGKPKANPEQELNETNDETKAPEEQEKTFLEEVEAARSEKRLKYINYSIDKLRDMAKEVGKSGFKINKYYKLDKLSLIEAIVQAEDMIALEKAAEEAESTEVSMPDDEVN